MYIVAVYINPEANRNAIEFSERLTWLDCSVSTSGQCKMAGGFNAALHEKNRVMTDEWERGLRLVHHGVVPHKLHTRCSAADIDPCFRVK